MFLPLFYPLIFKNVAPMPKWHKIKSESSKMRHNSSFCSTILVRGSLKISFQKVQSRKNLFAVKLWFTSCKLGTTYESAMIFKLRPRKLPQGFQPLSCFWTRCRAYMQKQGDLRIWAPRNIEFDIVQKPFLQVWHCLEAILTLPGQNCGIKMVFLVKFLGVLVLDIA